MPQIQVFQCPSCGANVSYDGGSEITFPCQYCGTTLVVPAELRAPVERAQAVPAPAPKPVAIPSARPVSPSRPVSKTASLGAIGGCILFAVPVIGFVLAMVYILSFSGSYKQALNAARSDPHVIEVLGAPVEASWWPPTGEIECGDACYANYRIPIHGSQKSGYIIVMSNSTGGAFNEGTWILNASVHVDGGETFPLK